MRDLELLERPPWIIAHRGVSARCPENTRAAFDAAVDAGADAIEFDVQLSLDGETMVSHDRTLDRYGYPHRSVRDLESDTLRTFDMGRWFDPVFKGERMPLLSEVLDRYARVMPLCIELKVRDETDERKEAFIAALLAAVGAHATLSRLHILSFDIDLLERIHGAGTTLPLVWNLRATDRLTANDLATRQWVWGVDLPVALLSAERVALGHDLGKRMFCYTCNEPDDIRRAAACGVDAIVTDDPEATRAVLLEAR